MKSRALILLVLVSQVACGRSGEANSPLPFPERWVRGSLTWDRRAAPQSGDALPLTVSLELADPSAMRALGVGPGSPRPCYAVRLLHRRAPDEPARVVGVATTDLSALWTESPQVCFHVGMKWSWQLLLQSKPGAPGSPMAGGRMVVVAGERAPSEQFAVILTRQPKTQQEYLEYRDYERFTVARSEWVSLGR